LTASRPSINDYLNYRKKVLYLELLGVNLETVAEIPLPLDGNELFIDGRPERGAGSKFAVRNPSTGTVFASPIGASESQVEAAIKAARRTFDSGIWSQISGAARAVHLRRFAAALKERAAQITDLVIAEAGCPRNAPVMFAQVAAPLRQTSEVVDFYLSLPEHEENPLPVAEQTSPLGKKMQSRRYYTPIGVVAAIAAYNYPFFTAMWKIFPALVAGNCVVLRPSPLTPLSALSFAEAAIAAELPHGVLNVVIEEGIAGAQLLTTHEDVDMVAFTGSTAVGKQVMRQAADTMKRLQLELGGKSAQIFLPDAVAQAGNAAAGVCLAHAGQGCALGTRIFVPETEKANVLEAMRASLANVVIGDAEDPATQLGPLISEAQVARCERFVQLAMEAGGRVVCGGKRVPGKGGYFFEPTVLDVPDQKNPAASEEIFGPVICVIGYRDLDHAVAMANDSAYGLSGYVYGGNPEECFAVAQRLKTGTVNVNAGMLSTYVSSGGQRLSGIGRERGLEGIRLYQQLKCINQGL
jgi:aldehyde dehydrogenase (NAD+)